MGYTFKLVPHKERGTWFVATQWMGQTSLNPFRFSHKGCFAGNDVFHDSFEDAQRFLRKCKRMEWQRVRREAREARVAEKYESRIRQWDWVWLKSEALRNICDNEEGDQIGSNFLGTVFSIMPSGKYYTPWACSNVSEAQARADEMFLEALEKVAGEYGMWVQSGEGDPCDIFLCCHVEEEEAAVA